MTKSFIPGVMLLVLVALALGAACGDAGGASSPDAAGDASTMDVLEIAEEVAPPGPDSDAVAVGDALDGGSEDTSVDTPLAGPPCNPYTQDGCEDGEKCTFDIFDNIICGEAGDLPIGETCEGDSECTAGICISLNGTDSYCYEFCKIDGHCEPGAECLSLQNAPFKICEIDGIYDFCTLLSDTCDAGKGCYWANDDAPVCLPEGTGGTKDSCEGPSDCAATHTCINKNCLPLCKKATPSPCGDAFTPCADYYPPHQIGYCDV
jgi:hypothetical protein